MDFLQVLGAAITFGSALGATVAGFFAYRQKSLVLLLRESNKDYKDRVVQLEQDRDRLEVTVKTQDGKIKMLESQKELPLQKLTALIIEQHTALVSAITKLTTEIININQGQK